MYANDSNSTAISRLIYLFLFTKHWSRPYLSCVVSRSLKEDKLIMEDLIVAAHNNAKIQLKSKTSEEISKATGGFNIPGFKWPL